MRLAALLLAALPVVAAAADPQPAVEDLLPLAVGNKWTYRVAGPPGQPPERFTIRVARQEMVGQQTCYVLEGVRDRVVATEHVAFTRDGLTRFRADKEDVDPPVTILKAPAARPTPWAIAKYQVGERSGSASFRQDNATGVMVVQAGRYKGGVIVTADVTSETGMRTTTLWYAPGVGLVKQMIGDPKAPGRTPYFTMELEKFEKGS